MSIMRPFDANLVEIVSGSALDSFRKGVVDCILDEVDRRGLPANLTVHSFRYDRMFRYAVDGKIKLFYSPDPHAVSGIVKFDNGRQVKVSAPHLEINPDIESLIKKAVALIKLPFTIYKKASQPFLGDISEQYEIPPGKALHVQDMIKTNQEPSEIVEYILKQSSL